VRFHSSVNFISTTNNGSIPQKDPFVQFPTKATVRQAEEQAHEEGLRNEKEVIEQYNEDEVVAVDYSKGCCETCGNEFSEECPQIITTCQHKPSLCRECAGVYDNNTMFCFGCQNEVQVVTADTPPPPPTSTQKEEEPELTPEKPEEKKVLRRKSALWSKDTLQPLETKYTRVNYSSFFENNLPQLVIVDHSGHSCHSKKYILSSF